MSDPLKLKFPEIFVHNSSFDSDSGTFEFKERVLFTMPLKTECSGENPIYF